MCALEPKRHRCWAYFMVDRIHVCDANAESVSMQSDDKVQVSLSSAARCPRTRLSALEEPPWSPAVF